MSSRFWKNPDNPGLESINHLLLWVKERGSAPLLYCKFEGEWVPTSAREFYDAVRSLSAALHALGVAPGDRVAILSENRPEWMISDFACLAAGVVDVPIYPTLPANQVEWILRHSGARGVFVSNSAQMQKVVEKWHDLPELEWACCFEGADASPALPMRGKLPEWQELTTGRFVAPEPESSFDQRLRETPGNRLATLIYTSGTTGLSKGVLLTHTNLASNLNYSVIGFPFSSDERRLSFLPLSHVTERHIGYCDFLFEQVTYYAESFDKVPENLLEVKPTFIVSVPRLFEKIAAKVKAEVEAKPKMARALFDWARRVGRRYAPYWLGDNSPYKDNQPKPSIGQPGVGLKLQAVLADRLVYSRIRQRLGGRVNKLIAGGAPLGKELAEFLLSLGLVIDQGYGLTETSPVIAVNKPGARRIGSVGRPLPNVEVRFDSDGELLVRGPSIFSGYYKAPEADAETFVDGWFRTGDIGYQDPDGFLFITDRKKDLIKTSGGKFVAPQPIESKLKSSPYIGEAVLVGDRRKFVSAMIVPNFPAVEEFSRQNNLSWSSRDELCKSERVRALIAGEIERVNSSLARFETIKKFVLLPSEFSIANGDITPTLKVRRRTVEEKYRSQIDQMYADETVASR